MIKAFGYILLVLVLVLPLSAQAQTNYVPAPVVPWLKAQGMGPKDKDITPVLSQKLKTKKDMLEDPDSDAPLRFLTADDHERFIESLKNEDIVELSLLEESYSRRAQQDLFQFGYEIFAGSETEGSQDKDRYGLPAGAVQDDFLLSIGDKLEVVFRGQRESTDVYTVDNSGLLVIKDLPPVPAAGRTIGAVRHSLEAYAGRLHNTEVFVSLDQIRQIDVLVVGHVKNPGRKTLTVFHSVLDALLESGGVEKTGSLRNIQVIRHGDRLYVDLYNLFLNRGRDIDLRLMDGDKIMVPPIGATVAVSGGVKRPGIFELESESDKPTVEALLDMAGGFLTPGDNRVLRLGLGHDGQESVVEVTNAMNAGFPQGSILMVETAQEKRAGTVVLNGHTRRPGIHALDKVETLSALLDSDQVMGPDIYPLIGVISRWDSESMARQWIGFSPLQVLKGQFDRKLQDEDVVHLFSRAQILALQDAKRMEIEATEQDEALDDPVLISFLREHSSFVRGAVRQEGAYPIMGSTTLDSLLAVAGGLTREANRGHIEVTSALLGEDLQSDGRSGTLRRNIDLTKVRADTIYLEPGDTVRVNQSELKIEDKSVLIMGAVKNPGRYDLLPGDKISDLLRRAGGLTMQAYPPGAVFSRKSAREAEEQRFRLAARDLERSLATALQDPDEKLDPKQISMAQDLAAALREVQAVGRITVESDPAVLEVEPELDLLLQTGDRLYIPERTLTVEVSGEVLSPARLQFRKEKEARDYIDEAGGFTRSADKSRTFVMYPDGSAQPLQPSFWSHMPLQIPPGATIIVPRDPKPFDFIETARDFSQILSNLAITGIFIDDIKDDD